MIEILHRDDVHKIQDKTLKEYAIYSMGRLPDDFILPEYGYFVVIESYDELLPNPIKFTHCELPSIEDENFIPYIELVETSKNREVVEILFVIHNDFAISLILHTNILPSDMRAKILQLEKRYS